MEKKNVKEVIKELIPVAVDIISDKLSSKEDEIDNAKVGIVIDKNRDAHDIECRDNNCIINNIQNIQLIVYFYALVFN